MKSLFSQNLRDDMPAVTLPNSGEGGAVMPGDSINANNMESRPSIPLPSPGEGGPVGGTSGSMGQNGSMGTQNGTTGQNGSMGAQNGSMGIQNGTTGQNGTMGGNQNETMQPGTGQTVRPVTPLPSPGEGGPAFPGISSGGGTGTGTTGNRPVTPLPNVGEGGPVFPGTTGGNAGLNIPAIIGTIITTFPRPNAPCRFCANQNQTYGNVRFLNAASNYNPFRVYVNDQLFVSPLNFSEVTEYEKVPSGYQIVTVMGDNQYIYLQKPIMVPRDGSITVAICNTENGIDLFVVSDSSCAKSNYLSCLRVCNLSFNSGPLSVVIGNNDVQFMNVNFQEVTNFRVLAPANYIFYVVNGNRNIILSSSLNVRVDVSYTMYLFNWNISSPDAITVLIVEEH